jgi:hypothetical protein
MDNGRTDMVPRDELAVTLLRYAEAETKQPGEGTKDQ